MAFSLSMNDSGAIQTRGFETWLAGVHKDHADVLKQNRLLREERDFDEHKKGWKNNKNFKDDE